MIRRRCLRSLYMVCGLRALIPTSLEIRTRCYNPEEPPWRHGGFAEVWKGRYEDKEVACKVLKVYESDDFEPIKKVGHSNLTLRSLIR